MTRQPWRPSGGDVGSSTGIATAVLALLSAGGLVSLGLVLGSSVQQAAQGHLPGVPSVLQAPRSVHVSPPKAGSSGSPLGGQASS